MSLEREQLQVHWAAMVRVARSVLASRDEAEECAAAAMIQVLERQPDDVANLEAFMVTVAKRRAIDRLRSVDRERRRDALLAAQTPLVSEDASVRVVDQAAAVWMAGEAQRRLSAQSLRILQATSDGEDLRSIAAREGLTFRAAESDLFRARKLLRSVWTRALGLLGAAWAGLRRSIVPAVPVVASLVTILLVLPTDAGSGESLPTDRAQSTTSTAHPAPPALVAQPVKPSTARPNPRTAPKPRGSVSATPAVIVAERDPAGRTNIVTERHGSGEDAGVLGGLVACVVHVTISPDLHDLGC